MMTMKLCHVPRTTLSHLLFLIFYAHSVFVAHFALVLSGYNLLNDQTTYVTLNRQIHVACSRALICSEMIKTDTRQCSQFLHRIINC